MTVDTWIQALAAAGAVVSAYCAVRGLNRKYRGTPPPDLDGDSKE